MSQVFAVLIKQFFDPIGFNLHLGGVRLPSGDRLWAELGCFVQDGDARTQMWCIRGSKGTKVCLLCNNVFSGESKIVDEDKQALLACHVIKEEDRIAATDDELRANMWYLDAHASQPGFIELQQALGLTYHRHSLLLDRSLDDIVKPTSQYMHDWMRTLVANGVYNSVICQLLEEFIKAGSTNVYEICKGFIAQWRWPANIYAADRSDIFSDTRKKSHRKAGHLKCQASDLLSL